MACKTLKKYFVLNEFFLEMQCDKNEGGTRNLILRGNELINRIGRRIVDNDMVRIVWFLRNHPEVIALDFPYNEISDCGISTLTAFLKERPGIRYMNLMGNNIGPRGINYLVELGPILPLHSLRLSGNKFGSEGGKILSKLLTMKSALKFLDLSDTHQTISSLAYLMTALMPSRGGTEKLEYIDLGRPLPQEFHTVSDFHAAEFFGQVLKDNKRLKELHIQQYRFDFRDMEMLLEGLSANSTLLCLDLNNNNIGDDGVEYLCKYLKTSPPLEALMIGANNFGNLGAAALSFNLPFSKIRLLDITNNHVTDEGMIQIFHTIRKMLAMTALHLWGNEITHKSLVVLQRLFHTGLLNPDHTDVTLHCTDGELRAAWNFMVNRYTHRFYCVSDYGSAGVRKIAMISKPILEKQSICYKFHTDESKLGFPLYAGKTIDKETKVYEQCFFNPF